VLREEFGGPPMDLQFGLEFADTPLGCRKFLTFSGSQTGDKPSVHALLAPPGVDRLIADAQVAGEIDNLAPSVEEIEDTSTKLRRIASSSQSCLLFGTAA
jgi:hypothetical protein